MASFRIRFYRCLASLFPALYCRWYSRCCDEATGYHDEPGYLDGKGPLHDAWLLATWRSSRHHLP
jgi:hypothetical protein